MGFLVLERLHEAPLEIAAAQKKVVLSLKTEDDLFLVICTRCPFFGEDCDFAVWKRGGSTHLDREAVNPCGGFLCLGHCLDQDTVDIQDVYRVI